VEQQWFIVSNQILIEREAVPIFKHNRCIDAINPIGNFMHIRPGLAIRKCHFTLLIMEVTSYSSSQVGVVLLNCQAITPSMPENGHYLTFSTMPFLSAARLFVDLYQRLVT
jgi:hypothetical protein